MRVLLDTNAYSALERGRAEVTERVQRAEEVFLSAAPAVVVLASYVRQGQDAILATPKLPSVEPGRHRVTIEVVTLRRAFCIVEINYFGMAQDYEE